MAVGVDSVATSTDVRCKLDLTIFDVRDSKADEEKASIGALTVWCFFSLEREVENKSELVICLSELTDRLAVDRFGKTRTSEELEETKNVADDSIVSVDLNVEDVDVVRIV